MFLCKSILISVALDSQHAGQTSSSEHPSTCENPSTRESPSNPSASEYPGTANYSKTAATLPDEIFDTSKLVSDLDRSTSAVLAFIAENQMTQNMKEIVL